MAVLLVYNFLISIILNIEEVNFLHYNNFVFIIRREYAAERERTAEKAFYFSFK